MTLEDFTKSYNTYGKCINQMSKPKNKLNEKQIKFQYDKYIRKSGSKELKIDSQWDIVRKKVFERDHGLCQLFSKLNVGELIQIKESLFQETKIIDPAHVFGKGAFPHMKYDVDNIFCLTRLFHSRLDSYHDPISGRSISREVHDEWWIRIIGDSQYNILKRKALKR